MIRGNRKLALQDLSNRGNDVSLEVNWNNSKDIKNCKHIKIKVGDGPEAIIKQDHLFAILMAITPPKKQEIMVGNFMDYQEVRNYHTVIDVQLQKDVQKNEIIGIPLTISINQETGDIKVKP